MKRVREVIVVEGKYDAIRVKSAVEAVVVETHGFGLFRDKEQLALLRRLAASRGVQVLTDSDGAGLCHPQLSQRRFTAQPGQARLYPGNRRKGAAQGRAL